MLSLDNLETRRNNSVQEGYVMDTPSADVSDMEELLIQILVHSKKSCLYRTFRFLENADFETYRVALSVESFKSAFELYLVNVPEHELSEHPRLRLLMHTLVNQVLKLEYSQHQMLTNFQLLMSYINIVGEVAKQCSPK